MNQPFYKLRVTDDSVELIRSLHPHLKKKVRASLKSIQTNPDAGKALKNELTGLRSFRVSKFRIIYRISKSKHIEIVAIGPRNIIYEETFRIISREKRKV